MIKFEDKIENVLSLYHQRMNDEQQLVSSLSHTEIMHRRDEMLLPVGAETGMFLNMLAKSAKSKTILEIGTSYGYSAVWLAEAARANGGCVITLEMSGGKTAYAKTKIEEAGLTDFVDFKIGDALELIRAETGTFDFVLLDLWKELYVSCFDLFVKKLDKGAWVVADNMIYPPQDAKETAAYKKKVVGSKMFNTMLLPIGSGIEVSQYL
jgi:predicted O-methyltransferase YrrM